MLPLTAFALSTHTQLPFALGGGSSGITSERRAAIDFFKHIWHEWEPPGVVLLSLTIQVVLIIMGKRRRYTYGRLPTFFTWINYLSADAVAVYAIGIITTRVARATHPKSELSIQLNAFWAPFLLLHLGGPETITAYSLEDNELWSRHLLSMCTQAAMSLYVFVVAWNGSALSVLTVGMLFAGLIKYGERVCVLWLASSDRFRRSIPNSPLVRSKVVEEQMLMMAEGFRVVPHRVNEIPLQEDILQIDLNSPGIPDDFQIREELSIAEGLLRISQRVFVDFSLFSRDRNASLALLEGKNFRSTFKIIEIELGLMFDVLYTKANVAASAWGAISRSTTILITAVVAVVFSSLEAHHNPYRAADLLTTLVLLGGAIFLEGYALSILVFSDKTACWLIRTRKLNTLKFINMLKPLSKRRRWSSVVAQFSILSYSLCETHRFYDCLLRFFKIDEKIYKHNYTSHVSVPDNLKWSIMEMTTAKAAAEAKAEAAAKAAAEAKAEAAAMAASEAKAKAKAMVAGFAADLASEAEAKAATKAATTAEAEAAAVAAATVEAEAAAEAAAKAAAEAQAEADAKVFPGESLLVSLNKPELIWSVKLEFDESIIIWHIATELVLDFGDDENHSCRSERNLSCMILSRYMMYLLVHHPQMLPTPRITSIKFMDTYIEAKNFFVEMKRSGKARMGRKGKLEELRQNVMTDLDVTIAREDRSKFLLFHGCRLASKIDEYDMTTREEIICKVWIEKLIFAAKESNSRYHCQQLRMGGEMLTHVWLLMAHFGLTNHFQKLEDPSVVELIVT